MSGEWQVPDDPYAAPIVLHMDDVGAVVEAVVLPGDLGVELVTADHAAITADDLRTIAARLVAIADTIQPPTHDPNAEEWVVAWEAEWTGQKGNGFRLTKWLAETLAADANRRHPTITHRVVHQSELGR